MTVSAPARPLSGTIDVDEFSAFLETRPKEERWHLIEGVAVRMNPPSLAHQRIAGNFQALLDQSFAEQRLDLCAYHRIAIRLPGLSNFQPEPDVVVVPGLAGNELYAERFFLVAEVLSPSNTPSEIRTKLRRYREAPENLYLIVIEPRKIEVEIYPRSRHWEPVALSLPGDLIELPEFGFRCTVADLYRGTQLGSRAGP